MLAGVSVDEVVARWGTDQMADRDVAIALAEHGIAVQKNEPLWSGLFIAVVAAVRRLHFIIVDERNPVLGTQVFDPDRSAYWEQNKEFLAQSGAISYVLAVFDRSTPLASEYEAAVDSGSND